MDLSDKIDSMEKLIEVLQGFDSPHFWEYTLSRVLMDLGPMTEDNWWHWREHIRNKLEVRTRVYWASQWELNHLCVREGTHGVLTCIFANCYDHPALRHIELVHHVHVSKEDEGMICYTPNDEYGRRDRQVRTKVGRYLTQFFGPEGEVQRGLLSADNIRQQASCHMMQYKPEYKLEFAETADEIENVYRTGPSSCMSERAGNYGCGGRHPVTIYAEARPTIKCAYLVLNTEIVARTLVREDSKRYIRIYGDDAKMKAALDAAGYRYGGDMEGVSFPQIEVSGGYMMPYIDGDSQDITERGDRLVVVGSGEYEATMTTGVLRTSERTYCEDCDEHHHEDDGSYLECVERFVCQGCIDSYYITVYDRRENQVWRHADDENVVTCSDGERYVDGDAAERNGYVYAEDTEEYTPEDDCVEVDGSMYTEGACMQVETDDGAEQWVMKIDTLSECEEYAFDFTTMTLLKLDEFSDVERVSRSIRFDIVVRRVALWLGTEFHIGSVQEALNWQPVSQVIADVAYTIRSRAAYQHHVGISAAEQEWQEFLLELQPIEQVAA